MKRSPAKPAFRHVAIVGVGLIGGSLGLAIKRRMPRVRVTGYDRRKVIASAIRRGAIDQGAGTLAAAVRDADLVILAAPLSAIMRLLPTVARSVPSHAVVTDVGSVKSAVVKASERYFPSGHFVGGHPMAGVELSGIDAAHPLLFENALYVLTPGKHSSKTVVTRLGTFFKGIGARVAVMDAGVHDRVASAVSHVPQLTAVALMNAAGNHPDAARFLNLAAGGFRDMTRIGSSRFGMWGDVLTFNRRPVLRSLDALMRELAAYRRSVAGDAWVLRSSFHRSRSLRTRIPKTMKGFLHSLSEVYVVLDDKHGVLAKLTRVLANARINIKDLELVKIREGLGGTFRLAFESDAVAGRARRVLRRAGFEIAQ